MEFHLIKHFKNLLGKVKKMHQKVFSIDDSPENIARGFALGSFISMTPFVGLHLLLSLGLASLFGWNRIAAGIAAFNTNMLTGVFIFSFNYYLGSILIGKKADFVFPDKLDLSFVLNMIHSGSDVFMTLIVGGFITGLITAFISYSLMKKIISKRNRLVVKQ